MNGPTPFFTFSREIKMKKLLLSLALLATSAFSTITMAAGEVSLLDAVSRSSYYHGFSWEDGRFEAQVANLGYAKQVSAYIKKSDGSWTDFPLSFVRATGANKEVWAADFHAQSWAGGTNNLPPTGDTIEFVVKYQVNGQTYWDNNGAANYKLPHGAGSLLGKNVNVLLSNYNPTANIGQATNLTGQITLRNIAPNKTVKVIYTTDNWATTKEAIAGFSPYFALGYSYISNPNAIGFEEWTYNMEIGNATKVEYAISYTVNGQTYWDNNLGRNYVTTVTH